MSPLQAAGEFGTLSSGGRVGPVGMVLVGLGVAAASVALASFVRVILEETEQERRRWREILHAAVRPLGLTVEQPAGMGEFASASGTVDGYRVVVDRFLDTSGTGRRLRYRIRLETGSPLGISAASRFLPSQARSVGDAEFDAAVKVTGDPHQLTAVFDPEARKLVARLVHTSVSHRGGAFLQVQDDGFGSTELRFRLQDLARAARLLDRKPSLEALRERALTDPVAGVRAVATERLIAALGDDHPALRPFLGHELPAVVRAAALKLADGPSGDPELETALQGVLGDGDPEVVAALARVGTPASVPALQRVVDRSFAVSPAATAARDAIRTIQSRAVGGGRGALAVSELLGGELATADADAGRLAEAARSRPATARTE